MSSKQLAEDGDNQCWYAEIHDHYSCSNIAWIVHAWTLPKWKWREWSELVLSLNWIIKELIYARKTKLDIVRMQTYGKTDLPIVQLKGGIRGTLYLPFFLFKQCVGPQQKVMDRRTNTAWDCSCWNSRHIERSCWITIHPRQLINKDTS